MLTDRQMFNLFSDALVDEPADPTFLDELFEVLVHEVRSTNLVPTATSSLAVVRDRSRAAIQWTALAAAALVVAVGFTLLLARPDVGPEPTPSPSPSALPALTGTFTSVLGGYSIAYPAGAQARPGTQVMEPGLHSWSPDDPWVDVIFDARTRGNWDIVSVPIAVGTTPDQWVADEIEAVMLSTGAFTGCGPRMTSEPVSIDGVTGYIDTHCAASGFAAVVTSGRRAYVFDLEGDNPSMAWFRAVLATVRLNPGVAAPYVSPGPSPSAGPAAS